MAQYNSISMPTTPMYPDGSFEGKMKKGFKKLFSMGKKKDGSLGKSRSGSERGSSSRVEEEGQRSSRRFNIFSKRPKNKPVDDTPASNLMEANVSITDNAQEAADEKEHGLMGRIKRDLHIHTNRKSESGAAKEEHKPTQLDHHAGNANKKKTAEAEAVSVDHAVKKVDPSPAAHGETKKLDEKEGKIDQHHHHQHKDGEATTNPEHEAAGEKKLDSTDHPLEVKESNGCEILGKGLQRVCLPWTINKDE